MKEEIKKDSQYYFRLFKDALHNEEKRFDKYQELVAFFELTQNELPSYSGQKPWVININTPYAVDAVNLRVASLQASDYIGALEPLSPEDVETVQKLNDVYREFWEEMNTDKHVNDAILISAVLGQAYSHVVYDSNDTVGGRNRKRKGKLKHYFLDSTSISIDPKALSLKTAEYVCVTERITKKQIKQNYPDFDWENFKSENLSPQQRGEIFFGTTYTPEREDDIFTKITIYEKDGKKIEKTVLIDSVIVEETKEMPIHCFPIAQLRWQKKIKSPYGTSLLEMLLPLQKVVDEIESANANANMQYSSPSYVISEDSGIDPEQLALNAGAPAAVYVIASGNKISDVIQPLIPNRGIDQGLVATKQELERSIYKLAGVNDAFLGDTGTPGNTAGGAELAMTRARTIENRVLTNIEEYIEDLTEIIVSYITKAYKGETIYSRGEKQSNGQYQFKQFDIPEDADEIDYNFYIKLDVRSKFSQERNRQLIQELWAQERQYDTGDLKGLTFLDVIKAYDIPQTREFVDRYERMSQMDAEQRAELIAEIVRVGEQFGVDAALINAAISDIMLNRQEQPSLEMFMQAVEQAQQQQTQQREALVNAMTEQQMQQQMQMQLEQDAALENQEITAENQGMGAIEDQEITAL